MADVIKEIANAVKDKISTGVADSTNPYKIDYGDERFAKVESQKTAALDELEKTYSGMIGESDKYYQDQINASKDWADKQSQLQQEQSDFAIEQIEQQKDQAQKDYTTEQSGAYADWQKQSNRYGAEAERQASAGLNGSGFSESSQVSMYNTYQSRVAAAREAYNRAVLNYDNAIKDARLQNNAALAEIAFNALQQQLELSLQGFQYKNSLVLEQASKKMEVENNYYNRYQDVLNQINTENSLAEQIRQYNEAMDWEKYQFNFENKLGEFAETSSGSSGGGSGTVSYNTYLANLSNKDRKALEEKGLNINGDTGDDLPSDTRDSILALGQGPISEKNLANQVASGKVTMSTSTKTGNTIFNYAGLRKK
jgi:hypothetical protein